MAASPNSGPSSPRDEVDTAHARAVAASHLSSRLPPSVLLPAGRELRERAGYSRTASASGADVVGRAPGTGSDSPRGVGTGRGKGGVLGFWSRHVSVAVPIEARRDHLALERTFLAYTRTSIALSMTGVTAAQLFRLQHALRPDMALGFFVVGKPVAAVFVAASLTVTVISAARFWRQQRAMLRGVVVAGGIEIVVIMGLAIALCTALFVLLVAIDIRKGLR